jgi:hypothetical protein
MGDEWVTIERFLDRIGAQVARSRLEAGGVEAILADEGMGGLFGYGLIKGVRLQVTAADEARAREILGEAPSGEIGEGEAMDLKSYFEGTEGTGVLSTASAAGEVDAAIYSRPHVLDDGTVAFVMRDRLTHRNVGENPHAAYLFIERGGGFSGVRLLLVKVGEERDTPLADQLRRRHLSPEEDAALGPKFVVFFRVERELPLIGSGG